LHELAARNKKKLQRKKKSDFFHIFGRVTGCEQQKKKKGKNKTKNKRTNK
jgi:hypothetical protein